MSGNIIPLSRLTSKGSSSLGLGSLLSGNMNLLPILFIFMSGKKGAPFGKLNNLLNLGGSFGGITSKLNLSNDNIAKSLEILSAVGPLGLSKNTAMISKFSTFLNAIYKVNTVQKYRKDINSIATDDDPTDNADSPSINTNLKMFEAVEQILGDDMKEPVNKAKNMLGMYKNFRSATNTFKDKKESKGSLDISDMFGIVKPILGDKHSSTFDGVQGMMSMMNLMSSLNLSNDSDIDGESEDGVAKPKKPLDMKNMLSMVNMMSNLGVGPLSQLGKSSGINPSDLFGLMNKLGGKTRKVDEDKIIEISEYDEENFSDDDEIENTL